MTVWIAVITLHMAIGTIGTMDAIIGTGQYASTDRAACETDGHVAVERLGARKVMATDRFSFACVELPVRP